MAEQSGFFDAHLVNGEYDRVYLAESFAKYFSSFIGNGIFGGKSNELMVSQKSSPDMSVNVLSGQAWINGYWYENDDNLPLAIDIADGVLNRIDLVVVRWNNSERVIRIAIKKGTSATNPSAPILQRDADIYELKLAQVYVKAGATKITQENITDTRLDLASCGLVQGVIKQFDTTEFGKQINSFIENFEASSITEMQSIIDYINSMVSSDLATRLTLDVEALKQIAIEDEQDIGCFYRINSQTGRKEWINPACAPGREYPLVERWNNEPVYQMTLYAASLPNNSAMVLYTNAGWDKIVSVSGYALDRDDLTSYPFPVTLHSKVTPLAVISIIKSEGSLIITTNGDASHFEAYITIKYTKG